VAQQSFQLPDWSLLPGQKWRRATETLSQQLPTSPLVFRQQQPPSEPADAQRQAAGQGICSGMVNASRQIRDFVLYRDGENMIKWPFFWIECYCTATPHPRQL
jgi:hypothetical protein